MKLAIIGSRTFHDFDKALSVFKESFPKGLVNEIVSGGAIGADAIGKRIAEHLGLKYTEFLPEWKKYGRSAGIKRNTLIVNAADVVLAFWDGKSRGTQNSIRTARAQGKRVIISTFMPEIQNNDPLDFIRNT